MSPLQPIRSLALSNLIIIKSWFFPHLYAPPCTSVHLCAPPCTPMCTSVHLHAHLSASPCTSVHISDKLSVPTTANQIISIDQPNYHKILIFFPTTSWKRLHAARIDQLAWLWWASNCFSKIKQNINLHFFSNTKIKVNALFSKKRFLLPFNW